jgi:uncharacterized protein
MTKRAFRFAVGLVGLHVADDSFFQPQPGTTATDHIVSGLVPLVLLGLAAWAFPRARAGSKAALALTAGLFGLLIGGAEAIYYAVQNSPAGDDYTGFVAFAAGLGLAAAGLAGLWNTRRRTGARVWRCARRALIAVGAVAALVPLAAAYVYAHSAHSELAGANLAVASSEVRFDSVGGASLAGRWIPSRNGAAVVAYPGRKDQVEMLARAGYGVLVFTRRGEGESEGDPQRWTLAKDIRGAVAFARAQPGVDRDRVGGIGFSVGGESMLQAAAETKQLRAVVSEGAGARTIKESVHLAGAMKWVGLGGDVIYTAASAVFSDQKPPVDLLDDVGRIGARPVFLVYSPRKGIGGEELNPRYYDALTGPKAIWGIPESAHTGGYAARPNEYRRRVVGFFDRALRPEPRSNGA